MSSVYCALESLSEYKQESTQGWNRTNKKAKDTEQTLQRLNEILFLCMFQSKGSYGRMNTLPEAVHMLISRICLSVISYDKMYFQFSSVIQSCPTLCDPVDCRTPGFPVHHQLLELAQTCLSSWWCHPTISSSVIPFSSCLQSFPKYSSIK